MPFASIKSVLEPFCLTWYQRDQEYYLTDQEVLESFCLTWYQRSNRRLTDQSLSFGTILFIMVPKEAFKDFKKEYLEELGSEAKEEYNKALKL